MRDPDVEHFNARAESYDRSLVGRLVHRPIQHAVLGIAIRLVPRPQAILDVGCGTGAWLELAAAQFPRAELLGVDPATEMVRVASARFGGDPRIRLVVARAERLPLARDAFDLIVSCNSFHHWAD
jgi:ubiquinone/menaquinone biosynthesis C-methylase UbiE